MACSYANNDNGLKFLPAHIADLDQCFSAQKPLADARMHRFTLVGNHRSSRPVISKLNFRGSGALRLPSQEMSSASPLVPRVCRSTVYNYSEFAYAPPLRLNAKSYEPATHSVPVHTKIRATIDKVRVDVDEIALHPDLGDIREAPNH